MTIERIKNWVPPMGSYVEEITDWVQRHYQDHTEESSARIEDITNEVSTIDLNDLAKTSLADPGADRIVFWDDSDTQYEWLVPNKGISISVNNLNVDHDAANNFVANEHIDYTSAIDNTNYVVKTPIRCRAYLGTDQDDFADNTWTLIDLDTETYDSGSDFNTTTHQYTTPVAGYYMICGSVYLHDMTADVRYGVRVYNTTDAKEEAISMFVIGNAIANTILNCSMITYMGASKVLELQAYQNSGGALVDIEAGDPYTSLSIHLLST